MSFDLFEKRDPVSEMIKNIVTGKADRAKEKPPAGDIVFVKSTGYKNFAVYVGKKRVIHEAPFEEFLDGKLLTFP